MNSDAVEPTSAGPPSADASTELCVVLTTFTDEKAAGSARKRLEQRIARDGDEVLDLVVLNVDGKHQARVHDPRRTLAGALTPALTWGVFGLLAGGLQSLAIWAIIGAICGGVYAYLFEHLLTKDELVRIGRALPASSSAIVAFVRGADPTRTLASVESFTPASASVAAITTALDVRLHGDAAQGVDPELTMILVRYSGEHAARKALAGSIAAKHPDPATPKVELLVESDEHGHRRVIDPTNGSGALSVPDALTWGAFGLVWGAIVGFAGGGGGILSFIDSAVVTGVLWTVFGLVAGALYGLWAGRGVSARRLKRVGRLLTPDASMAVAWAEGPVDPHEMRQWTAGASDRMVLGFTAAGQGAALQAPASPPSA